MQTITSPQTPRYTALGKNYGKFEILGCYPGYGTTLGNALRRVLLSSLDGAAAKSVKIKGVAHEFSTISGVMEDVVQIILNLKQVRFKLHGEEAVKITLKSKGEGVVTAAAIKTPSSVEIINPDQVIATDAIYTPVRRVNYEIENMRVGKRTDYDKITLEVVTDGSITPVEAFEKSVAILVSQFSSLALVEGDASEVKEEAQAEEEVTEVKEKKPKKVSKKKAKSE